MTTISRKQAYATRGPEAALEQDGLAPRLRVVDDFDLTVILDAAGTVTYVDPAVTAALGYTPDEVVGVSIQTLAAPEDLDTWWRIVRENGSGRAELRLMRTDGSRCLVEASATNLLHVPGMGVIVARFHALARREPVPWWAWDEVLEPAHLVQFYADDEYLLDSIHTFVSMGLSAGESCVVIATPEHCEGIEARLEAGGLDLSAARARGTYIALDAAKTLARFMIAGAPEPGRFAEVVGGIIAQAARGGRHVRAFGEMVALLWAEGNAAAAIHLEELWNDLSDAAPTPFTLCCGYPMQGFASEANGAPFADICARHSHVIPAEGYTALAGPDERLRAITLLQQKAAALEAEIDERKQLEARKNAFISMASHELKTPVTSLKGFTQILQRRLRQQGADSQTLLFLDRMDAQLKRLTNLIADLLDLSRMQTGNLVFRESSFDFDDLVRETVENVQAAITTHHLRVEGATSAMVVGDRDRLDQVLINLLTNAIKYSPQADTVLISLSGDDARVEVAVRDFGIGIAEAHHERIFERFYQVSGPDENTYPGLGIGLHIVRTIVERHSGRVWLESREGAGSTFRVTLPKRSGEHDDSHPLASSGEAVG